MGTTAELSIMLQDIQKQVASMNMKHDENTITLNTNTAELTMLSTSFANLNDQISKIKEEIVSIKNDNDNTRNRVDDVDNRMKNLEKHQKYAMTLIQSQHNNLNTLQQIQESTKLVIQNAPKDLDSQQITKNLSEWSGFDMNHPYVDKITSVPVKDKELATIFISFQHATFRNQFLKMCKSKQRDSEGKYIGITCEQIFTIPQNHPCCGVEIQFRESLTTTNRQILKEIRENRKLFKYYWINNGNFLIKKQMILMIQSLFESSPFIN